MPNSWKEVEIMTDSGLMVKGIAPVILSASRSTDIPAFFSKWFFNRLEKGYVKWINPFNRIPQYVSFQHVRVIVFWTKNPKPVIPYLNQLDEKDIHYYFLYTVNDYDTEEFEPNVPPLFERIEAMKELSAKIGKERVIWRFDPLILTEKITVEKLLEKVWLLGNKLIPYTDKLIFGWINISPYKKVQRNLVKDFPHIFNKNNLFSFEFTPQQKIDFAQGMQKILAEWRKINSNFNIASCSETLDLQQYGIEHNRCIDDELMIKLFRTDKKLMDFLGFDENRETLFPARPNLKDKGQRKSCKCIVSKDIGFYNTCNHLCTYCYANASRKIVTSNQNLLKEDEESILDDKSNLL